MHVEVGHALADTIIDGYERSAGIERPLHCGTQKLRVSEESLYLRVRQIRERLVVHARNQKAMSREQWPVIQKSQRLRVLEDHVGRSLTSSDSAEQTVSRHKLILCGGEICPSFREEMLAR